MKKITLFWVTIFIIASTLVFGAWTPAQMQGQEVERRYIDGDIISTLSNEDVYFSSRELTNASTAGGAPIYSDNEGLQNCCGPLAGTAIVAFYDKYFPNLIEGWDSYYPSSGKYRFQIAQYTDPVLFNLYDLMKCNVEAHGVSEAEFKSGLQTYFKNHGYSLSYSNAMSSGKLNYNTCVSAINNNKVIALFTAPGKVYDIAEYSDHNCFIEYNITSSHIMFAFGYVELKYYNNGVNFRTERFVKVATSLGSHEQAYYKINSDNLDAAYVINVD